jgi:hypothetical protein
MKVIISGVMWLKVEMGKSGIIPVIVPQREIQCIIIMMKFPVLRRTKSGKLRQIHNLLFNRFISVKKGKGDVFELCGAGVILRCFS